MRSQVLSACCLFFVSVAHAEPLKVTATLSTFASLVELVGGEDVVVSTIASPRFNPHFIEPRPSDVVKVKRADLLVHGGLDLEAWRGPLVDAAGRSDLRPGGSRELDLSKGVALREVPSAQISRAEGDIHMFGNPHYWLSPESGVIMARGIEQKLAELLPERAGQLRQRREIFENALQKRMIAWRNLSSALKGREILAYHNEWVYLTEFLGLQGGQFIEPKPGIPPSPKHVEFLMKYLPEHHVGAILQSTYYPDNASKQLAAAANIPVLKLCQNVEELEACGDYIGMLEYNVQAIVRAMSAQP